jgi:hypothetical protein
MHAALKRKLDHGAAHLCRLPAAQQFSQVVAAELLQVAVEQSASNIVDSFRHLPAALEISSSEVARLLQMAVGRRDADSVRWLCMWPAAQEIRRTTAAQLLQLAVKQGDGVGSKSTKWLCTLPEAQWLCGDVVVKLLQAASERSIDKCGMRSLCKLSAAQDVTSADLQLLLWAVVWLDDVTDGNAWPSNTELVCWLPAGKQLSKRAVVRLMQAAIEFGNKCMLRGLCSLKVARKLDPALMLRVQTALCSIAAAPSRTVRSNAEAVEWLRQRFGETLTCL